jgi:predicted DNA-binding WGR domain protein
VRNEHGLFEKIDPARNQMRFYAVTVAPNLFGQWAMIREWGRIGQAGTIRQTWFESESEPKLPQCPRKLTRIAHGG